MQVFEYAAQALFITQDSIHVSVPLPNRVCLSIHNQLIACVVLCDVLCDVMCCAVLCCVVWCGVVWYGVVV